ncbi:MAG: hypothetical protein IKC47_00735, partial [Clostridia bacterium]|nr:hypothetical protein [Clostridia bacterium]
RTCVALHRRIVVARRSTGSLLQFRAPGGFAVVKQLSTVFTLPPYHPKQSVQKHLCGIPVVAKHLFDVMILK